MKQLQNNFTTVEQSKRLLELGVPRWTADEYRDEKGFRHSLEGILDIELYFQNFPKDIPCWSVGRLIEIWEIITGEKWLHETELPIIEELISNFNYYSYDNDDPLDFSKLEE